VYSVLGLALGTVSARVAEFAVDIRCLL